ncbi:MAG: 3-dehydroquinate synthase family protein, partial [Planctomycetota bacterium]
MSPDGIPGHTIPVRIGAGSAMSYDVRIGSGVLGDLERLAAAFASALLVADSGVPDDLIDEARAATERGGPSIGVHRFERPIERVKTTASVHAICASLSEMGADRSTSLVIAVGGGIVGDTAGFAAAAYQRGVPVVQCPTTLLAMVDASVGGKTGVNLETPDGRLRKNYIGAFHQPRAVLADTRAIRSLSDRHHRAGLAECVKHACLSAAFGDPDLMAWTEANAEALLARDDSTLAELIARNVRVKAAVVAEDERERANSGGRALLNLGHTFAHAIEPIPTLSPDEDSAHAPLHHGEAVALGVCAAAATATSLDPSTDRDQYAARLRALFERVGLPTQVRALPPAEELAVSMRADKKARAGRLRLVLPDPDQTARTIDDPP